MTDAIQNYANKLPIEIQNALDGLDDDIERAIFVLLYSEEKMAFSEIQRELSDENKELHNQTVTNALKELSANGLIENKVAENHSEDPFSSYYQLSEYGERFFLSLFDSLGDVTGSGGRRQVMEYPGEGNLYQATSDLGSEITDNLKNHV